MSHLILIVDDDENIREAAHIGLTLVAGWSAVMATDGREACDIAAAHQPEVILLDMMMPGLSGVETLRALRSCVHTRDIPVLLLTASEEEDQPSWQELGFNGRLPKPFNPLTLATDIAATLGWKS